MGHNINNSPALRISGGPRIPMWKSLFVFEGNNAHGTITSDTKLETKFQLRLILAVEIVAHF